MDDGLSLLVDLKAVPNAVITEKPFLPQNLVFSHLFNIPLHPAMLQKMAMTRRFIPWHHGMLQPLRWLDVTSPVAAGQRCHFSTEKCNKFTVPQATQGRLSHLRGHLVYQPWMKTWYFCQVRRFGEDVCAPCVAAQTGHGFVFTDDPVVWQVGQTDEDLTDEKKDVLRNGTFDSTRKDQNSTGWDNKPVRGRPGRVVKWTNLLTSQFGTWPSIEAAARELGLSPWKIARCCKEGCQIEDFQLEFAIWPPMKDQTEQNCWMVSSYGRFRNSRGMLTHGYLAKTGYRTVSILGEWFLAHRVVAITFHGPPPNHFAWQVHHRDGDATNNRAENLTYVTSAENIQNSYKNHSRGTGGPALSLPVVCRNVREVVHFPSVLAAARELGVSWTAIARSCRQGSHIGDYQFQFAPPTEPELLKGEQWLPMIDPETRLEVPGRQVSSCGRIKSQRGWRDLITWGHQSKSGYFTAVIQGKPRRGVGVHQLVASTFLGPPPSPMHSEVNHKDFDRGNNRLDNLEYVTRSENRQHYLLYDNRGLARGKAVLGRPHGSEEDWVRYESLTKASKDLGIEQSKISKCARGIFEQAGGYNFRFVRSEEPAHLPGEEWRPVDLEVLQREKAERKGRRKQRQSIGKNSWNTLWILLTCQARWNTRFSHQGVSIHVIPWNLPYLFFLQSRVTGARRKKNIFVTHGAVLGCFVLNIRWQD